MCEPTDWDEGWMHDVGPDGWYTRPPGTDNAPTPVPDFAFPQFKPVTVEMAFGNVDPALLRMLTGCDTSPAFEPEFSLDIYNPPVPVRRRAWRVVWEWVRRTPRRYHPATRYYFPRVRVSGNEENT